MNIEEAIGSLIMTGFRGSSLDDPQCREDVRLLKEHHVKGVILFDTHLPTHQSIGGMRNIVSESQIRTLTDDLRNELGDDLIVAIDQEGGSVNRLGLFRDAGVSDQLSARVQGSMSERPLGATIRPVAQALHESGVNLTFAPCVDLEINPENPIIAGKDRALGRDPVRVTASASMIISTYHAHGVPCCLKHFPGHGSSTIDTHHGIADITDTHHDDEQRVYRMMIESMHGGRVPEFAVMTGHLMHRGFDSEFAASLSPEHTQQLLRDTLGFDGVVVTDSLDMGAIRMRHDPGTATMLSILAGADIALDGFNAPITPQHPERSHPAPVMHGAILDAVEGGLIDESRIMESVSRLARWSAGSPDNGVQH